MRTVLRKTLNFAMQNQYIVRPQMDPFPQAFGTPNQILRLTLNRFQGHSDICRDRATTRCN